VLRPAGTGILPREKELQEFGAGIKSAAEKLEREAPTLSEGQRTSARSSWSNRIGISSASARIPRDLNARRNEELQQVFERANVWSSIGRCREIRPDPAGSGLRQSKHDITDKVIKALNAPK